MVQSQKQDGVPGITGGQVFFLTVMIILVIGWFRTGTGGGDSAEMKDSTHPINSYMRTGYDSMPLVAKALRVDCLRLNGALRKDGHVYGAALDRIMNCIDYTGNKVAVYHVFDKRFTGGMVRVSTTYPKHPEWNMFTWKP